MNNLYKALTLFVAVAVPALGCPTPCPEDPNEPPTSLNVTSRGYPVGVFPQPNAVNGPESAISFGVQNLGTTVLLPIGVNWNHELDPADFQQELLERVSLDQAVDASGGETYFQVDFWGDQNRTVISGLPPELATPPDFSNEDLCAAFVVWVQALADATDAQYMALGIEVNFYKYLNGSLRDTYPDWLACYDLAYDAIKSVSPSTQVWPTFQLEDMLGLTGQSPADPNQFSDYTQSKVDALAFSTFPSISAPPFVPNPPFDSPAAVPNDYFSQMSAFANGKDIFIAETGWSIDCGFSGAPSSQAEWVVRAADLAAPLDQSGELIGFNWFFMSDPPAGSVIGFFSLGGLIDAAGSQRPAFDLWSQLAAL